MNNKPPAYGYTSAAVLGFGVLMAWVVGWAWHQLDRLQKDFSVVQSESFHLAEHVEEKMLTLKETLRALELRSDPAVQADFRRQTAHMTRWIQTNRFSVTSEQQRDVLDRLAAALDVYVAKTSLILQENVRVGSDADPKPVLERVEQEAAQILGLSRALRASWFRWGWPLFWAWPRSA
jgi:hypothetical protein